MIEIGGPADLTPGIYQRIVHGGEKLELGAEALAGVDRSRALFLKHLETGVICYGVNTGLGALAGLDLSEEEKELLPRHILLGRSAAIGPPFPGSVARGAMLIKLAQLLTGYSAVSVDLCRFIAERLNDAFTPWIPSFGLGMAGEIIPLCHLAQTFIGEGFLLGQDDERMPAVEWFAASGVVPYDPKSKEGLSLINGVAVAPAYAFDLVLRLRDTLALSTLTATAAAEGIGASINAYSEDAARLRRDPGIAEIAAMLRALLAESKIKRGERQPPVSFRVVPQVHGACLAAVDRLEERVVAEWNAIGDNPAFIADNASDRFGHLVHSGNFHAAELTAAIEAASLAAAQVALLSERRLHRLLDHRSSGLAPQLAGRPGLDAGLIILHKAVLGLTAKIRSLAVPPSLQHGESSFGQEDFMSMAFPALDRLAEIDRLTRLVAAYELYAALVAIEQRGEQPGSGIAPVLASVRRDIAAYDGDRPYGPDIERLVECIDGGRLPLPEITRAL